MFTGIVEATGTVLALTRSSGGARLSVDAPFAGELVPGESVAVNGCCLTQLPGEPGALVADLSLETLARTTLGALQPGRRVNLERAMPASARLGGHVVSGHVDGTTRLIDARPEGDGLRQRYALDEADAAFVVPKGSVTIDGVSLTVAALGLEWLEVALVPFTLAATTLGALEAGDRVNVEHDLIGKYVLRALALSGRAELPEAARVRLGLA